MIDGTIQLYQGAIAIVLMAAFNLTLILIVWAKMAMDNGEQ